MPYVKLPFLLASSAFHPGCRSSPKTVAYAFQRGLNSIYLQGPNIQAADYADFIGYGLCWHSVIDDHHTSEEEQFFPDIEAAVGEKGLMDGNVQQHSKQDNLLIKALSC